MSWGGVGEEAVRFHPGLLEDVIAESEAGRKSCWLEGKWGSSSWKYRIWEDVSQWKYGECGKKDFTLNNENNQFPLRKVYTTLKFESQKNHTASMKKYKLHVSAAY